MKQSRIEWTVLDIEYTSYIAVISSNLNMEKIVISVIYVASSCIISPLNKYIKRTCDLIFGHVYSPSLRLVIYFLLNPPGPLIMWVRIILDYNSRALKIIYRIIVQPVSAIIILKHLLSV